MKIRTILGAALVGAMSATTAFADTFSNYGNVEGWNVFIDHEKKSCLIEKKDDFDNVVQMGLTTDRSIAYIGVFTKAKTGIKRGEKEAVAILLGEHIYVGEATGMRGNITKDYSGGYVLTNDPQVVEDVAQQYTMTVFPEKDYAFTVDLAGTKKAIEMAQECNKKQM
ncbi:hypothetical protein [Falsiphaeobacter marinintestinus]|uniref:hypothetical protein n=1 Tax=Falsiphaeobacter marinintestinus TaxID=1492905 RepID=UPI0011B3821C|nr:hypothetical protein [Phaeobacter marinintestinus]